MHDGTLGSIEVSSTLAATCQYPLFFLLYFSSSTTRTASRQRNYDPTVLPATHQPAIELPATSVITFTFNTFIQQLTA